MNRPRMHHDEFEITESLVRRLLSDQHPAWADRPIDPVTSTGTSNAMFRLGDDLVARLPLQPESASNVRKEHRWLPRLAPHLPLAVPVAVAVGEPSEAYPMPWTICRWFEGDDATTAEIELRQAAVDLAEFLRALRSIDTAGAPVPEPIASNRGVALDTRDEITRRYIARCAPWFDVDALTAVWDHALQTPPWRAAPVWFHGDIAAGNLLVERGRLSAVIDWSPMGIGDPACDLIVAWEMFDAASRETFRRELDADDASWARSRGWALSTAVMALPYYEHTNAFMVAQAKHKIGILLGD